MPESAASLLPSVLVLGSVAVVALALALTRRSPAGLQNERTGAATMLLIATVVQAIHFGEETATGFHEQFPALFGQPPMPLAYFLSFNIVWLLIWLIAVPGTRRGNKWAFFAAWFLAIAAMLNGVAHPAMALTVGGYFPGLLTSPIIGVAGYRLWRRLGAAAPANQ